MWHPTIYRNPRNRSVVAIAYGREITTADTESGFVNDIRLSERLTPEAARDMAQALTLAADIADPDTPIHADADL